MNEKMISEPPAVEEPSAVEEKEGPAPPRTPELERWIVRLPEPNKLDLLFELEILLKGLDRFFNIQNLPLANMEQVITFNFVDEMEIVLQFVNRVADLTAVLLAASRQGQGDTQFRYYVESKLMGDYQRTRWRESVMEQKTPEDSLFVLHSTFQNFREIIRGLIQMKRIPYPLFFNLGSLITREIISNRYFNPSRSLRFRPEYDKIANRRIGHIIRAIEDKTLLHLGSIIILAFNRLLQYLHFINPRSESLETLKSTLLFFALIYSEAKYLMEYMENNLPALAAASGHPLASSFAETCDSLAFQLQMEMKKIQTGELLNLAKHQKLDPVRTAVENSHGILVNFFQQSIIQLLKVFAPEIQGEEIFPAFISKRKQSVKLRDDLAVLQLLMNKFEEITETTAAGASLDTYIKYLIIQKGLVARLRRETAPLMRYQDLVEFEKYFKFIEDLSLDDLHLMDKLDRFKMESKFFKIFVETTLGHIHNRSEIQEMPLNPNRIEKNLKRFIAEYLK